MPQIFHPSMNTISRVIIFGFVVLLSAAVALGMFLVRSSYITDAGVIRDQPTPFSHKHHIGDVGIDCRYCHQTVETQAFAGMPSTDVRALACAGVFWLVLLMTFLLSDYLTRQDVISSSEHISQFRHSCKVEMLEYHSAEDTDSNLSGTHQT